MILLGFLAYFAVPLIRNYKSELGEKYIREGFFRGKRREKGTLSYEDFFGKIDHFRVKIIF